MLDLRFASIPGLLDRVRPPRIDSVPRYRELHPLLATLEASSQYPSLSLSIALAAGVIALCVARHLRFPAIVLLLAVGAALGPEGAGWVEPRSLGAGLFGIVDFAVAIILFEGGMSLNINRLRREEAVIRKLVTLGALVTLVGATLAVRGLLAWDWGLSVLFGSLVVVTGPTVITPLLRDLRLRPRVKTVLEAEGVLIDPIGAVLAVLVLEIALAPGGSAVATESVDMFKRLGLGLGAGISFGFLLGGLLRFRSIIPKGFENIFALASVVLLFNLCDALVSHSGVLAVTLAGVVVGNLKTKAERDLREFKDQLTMLLVGLIFILLAADVRFEDITDLGWPGALVVASLVLVIRPLCVLASTRKSGLSTRERLFISWIGPRGVIAAAIASLTAAAMETRGMPGGAELRALVFLTIAGTVVLAGFTARPMASLLKLRLPSRDRVAIMGAHGLGLALGTELRDGGKPVVFIDTDPNQIRRAEELGFPVVFGDALEERSLMRAQSELVGTAIGMTPNDTLNSLFVGQASELFQVPAGYVALSRMDGEEVPEHIERKDCSVLFERSVDVGRWDVRARHGEVEIDYMMYDPPKPSENGGSAPRPVPPKQDKIGEGYVILTVRRGDTIFPMSVELKPKKGDIAAVAVYEPAREDVMIRLQERGWEPQS